MQHKATRGRPIKPATIKGRNYRAIPRTRADGSTAWAAQVYSAKTRQRQVVGTFDTPEEAVAACQQALGLLSEGPSITVAALQRRWLDYKRSERHLPKSLELAQERTDPFVRAYGTEPAKVITRGIAQEWAETHSLGQYSDLQAMFRYGAERLDVLPVSPFQGKRPQQASKADPDLARRALTEPELLELAAHAERRDGLWHEVMVLWMGYGGQRLAELVDTHVDRLEGLDANGNLRVRVETQWREEEQRSRHTKGKRSGQIVIPGWVYEKARPLIDAARQRGDGLVFVNPKGGRWVQHSYRYYWYRVRESWTATLPETHWLVRRLAKDASRGLTSHELRHSASTIIQARTRDLNASRAQLRHSKQAMTINYTHPEDADGLDAVSTAYTAQVVPLRRREAS